MDTVRLQVRPTTAEPNGFEVQIVVNEVEMTSAGAGLGMDPYSVLVPNNRFVATPARHIIPAARCACGVYGCGETDLAIVQDNDHVHWEWLKERPVRRSMTFDAEVYDAEVHRVGSDFSWETPVRTAGRLLLTRARPENLDRHSLRIDWVDNDWRDPEQFQVCLRHGEQHQVFLRFPWNGRTPEQLAYDVAHVLEEEEPQDWAASWHGIQPSAPRPPMAGPAWRNEQM